jgi:hypothetical protein
MAAVVAGRVPDNAAMEDGPRAAGNAVGSEPVAGIAAGEIQR